ncbi:MAG: TonB family protein [Bdellovibrionales bacterium]|jgi:colicin import membrane protein|nr:TonB family protein [Bdellovibrionales bacterium]
MRDQVAKASEIVSDSAVRLWKDDSMKAALIKSALGHVFLILIFTVRAYVFPSEPLRLESAIRVDIVGLPEKARTLPAPLEEPKPEAKPEAKKETAASKPELPPIVKQAEPPPKAPVVLQPKKPDPKQQQRDQAAALKRLEAMARLEQQARVDATQKALSEARAAQEAAAAVRGNQLSRGNSLSGLTRLDHARYLDEIEARIKNQWRPPRFLANAKLRVRVIMTINSSGGIIRKAIVQSSGNEVFDESAIAAIENSLPLPPPPDSLQGVLANQGVELDLEPTGFR